jgi:hypothetical protein
VDTEFLADLEDVGTDLTRGTEITVLVGFGLTCEVDVACGDCVAVGVGEGTGVGVGVESDKTSILSPGSRLIPSSDFEGMAWLVLVPAMKQINDKSKPTKESKPILRSFCITPPMIFLISYQFPHTLKLLRDISPWLKPGVLRGGDNSQSSLCLSDGMCQAK